MTRTHEFDLVFGMLNANCYLATYTKLNAGLSSTGYFSKSANMTGVRFDPYVYSQDKQRHACEYIMYIILIIMLIQEMITLFYSVRNVMFYFQRPSEDLKRRSKCKYYMLYIWRKIQVVLTKAIFGFIGYVSNFSTFLTFIGLILNFITFIYWTKLNSQLSDLHSVDYRNMTTSKSFIDSSLLLERAAISMMTYRKITALLTGIYCLRLVTVIFMFFPKLAYFWESLVNALMHNLYFLFFMFMINLGISMFTYFYFGSRIDEFSTMFSSFIVVFATILGYTDGIAQMLDMDPVLATIVLEFYYFLVIMILINMFIVFVNSEYRRLENMRAEEERRLSLKKGVFDDPPFFLYYIQRQFKNIMMYKWRKFFDKEGYKRMKAQRREEKIKKRIKDRMFKDANWDIQFQSFVDIDFMTNNSLSTITKISNTEIEELLKKKQFRYYWKFLALVAWMILHSFIIYIIYAPLEEDYTSLFSNTETLLFDSSLPQSVASNGAITSVLYSDHHLRMFGSDLLNYWYSKDMTNNKPVKVFQVYYPTEHLEPVTDFIVELDNLKINEQTFSDHNVHSLVKYRYLDFQKSTDEMGESLTTVPGDFQNFQMSFTMNEQEIKGTDDDYVDFNPPANDYIYSSESKTIHARVNSSLLYTDPYFIKIIGDNMIGPQTRKLSVKTVMKNTESNFYILLEMRFSRKIGDLYQVHYYYDQLDRKNLLLSFGMTFPLSMILKLTILILLIWSSISRIRQSFYEYKIWYSIGVKSTLSPQLISERHRKLPEYLRKLKATISIDDLLLWASSIFYITFLVSFLIAYTNFNSFENLVIKCSTDKTLSFSTYTTGWSVAGDRFNMNFFAGFEVLIITIQILIALRRLRMFKVILAAFKIIVGDLFALIIIMTLLILSFSLMINILLGDKYDEFAHPFQIHKLTGILISFKDLVTYTDNFDLFATLIFMIPYFLMIKYTVLYLIIAVIYSSIGVAHKQIEETDRYTTRYLGYGEFFSRTVEALKRNTGATNKYSLGNMNKYVSSLNFTADVEVFNKLIDNIHFTEGKSDVNSWKKLLGEASISEFSEREKISSKHQEINFNLLNYMVNVHHNFFEDLKNQGNDAKHEASLHRMQVFYKSFFNYFKYGYKQLMEQITIEHATFEQNTRVLEYNSKIEHQTYQDKNELFILEEKISKLLLKKQVYSKLYEPYAPEIKALELQTSRLSKKNTRRSSVMKSSSNMPSSRDQSPDVRFT